MVMSTVKTLSDVQSSYRKFQQNQLTARDCMYLVANTIYNVGAFTFACAVTPLIGNFTCYLTTELCGKNCHIYGDIIEDKSSKICIYNNDNLSMAPVL